MTQLARVVARMASVLRGGAGDECLSGGLHLHDAEVGLRRVVRLVGGEGGEEEGECVFRRVLRHI